MLWIALHFAQLSLDLIERSHQQAIQALSGGKPGREKPGPDSPGNKQTALPALAICDQIAVLSMNHSARQGGIETGMKRATAQALLPDISLLNHDPVREQQALRSLACWALQFTPSVGFGPPPLPTYKPAYKSTQKKPSINDAPLPLPGQAGILLEVEPSLRYFGGLPKLLETIHADLSALGYQATCGLAPTPGAAWLLARHHQLSPLQASLEPQHLLHDGAALPARLACLPINLLNAARPHIIALNTIGAHTIGDLLELPRAGLARRFGKNLLLEVDCALGSQAQPMGYFASPQQFSSKLELLADIEQADALLFAAGRLLVELTGWLRSRQAAVRSFDLIVFHEDTPVTSMTVRLTDPSRETQRLVGLLRERLNVLQLRAPVHTIELRCDRIQSLAIPSNELFISPASTQENLGRLLERLQVRLGRDQVQRLYLAEDHRPEAAYQVCVIDNLDQLGRSDKPLATNAPDSATDKIMAHLPTTLVAAQTGNLPRPLWLLREAQPLRERNNRPWLYSALNMVAGPERIETGWWDNNLVQRDYFVAEDDAHTLYWIYRERQAQHGGWYVQGRFG
ncbi:MAG: DNA polymerase Y family protein [Burkholderiaceae bacterium]